MLSKLLHLALFAVQCGLLMATICRFSRPHKSSPTGWIDVTDTCKETTDALCFSGYNPRIAYYHEAVGWWRVLYSEDECFTKKYLRRKLNCKDKQLPQEGCFRDKNHYKSFFLCWCTGNECNSRENITRIYLAQHSLYAVGRGCDPLPF